MIYRLVYDILLIAKEFIHGIQAVFISRLIFLGKIMENRKRNRWPIKYFVAFKDMPWQPTPVLLPGKSQGRRSLVSYKSMGSLESDTTEWLHFHFHDLRLNLIGFSWRKGWVFSRYQEYSLHFHLFYYYTEHQPYHRKYVFWVQRGKRYISLLLSSLQVPLLKPWKQPSYYLPPTLGSLIFLSFPLLVTPIAAK